MTQSIGLRRDLDERAEFLDGDDPAGVNLADLHLGGHRFDDVAALLGRGAIDRADVNRAVVLNVHLCAGLGLKRLDVLSGGADDFADLLRIDLDGEQSRRPLADFGPRLVDRLGHRIQDVQPRFLGAMQRLANDVMIDALGLDVELPWRDAEFRE